MTTQNTDDRNDDVTVQQSKAGEAAASAQAHHIDLSAELQQLHNTQGWQQGKHVARTLVKTADLRLVLIALHGGNRIEEHRAPGPITIHTLSGHIRVTADGRAADLPAGHVLTLERDVAHTVDALDESVFLLTIAWPAGTGAD